ncbi:hypothetical protein [Dongia sedimenti]|uniref:PNPLA domain-containing protein n=1 Tax=Dongia sedimenti TaxID=3064282 RepID=A0ABU0YU91_9PROT|nr:hypothetical protein [Rhodospirillaceae bacterium R-7]
MSTHNPADAAAAHHLLCELRDRIATQRLPYQHGDEGRALESLKEVFGLARDVMARHSGCRQFTQLVSDRLNLELRPVTAKWHRRSKAGFLNGRDGADEFRADLEQVQDRLRELSEELHVMAYGEAMPDWPEPDPVMTAEQIDRCFEPVGYGIPAIPQADDPAEKINEAERREVEARRTALAVPGSRPGFDAVGLALSGGGIRSAAFSLGVVQVLAERGLLKGVDFLSTVSGGGYTGSFISARLGASRDADIAGPRGPDTPEIQYLRQRAKYLAAADLKQRWAMVTAAWAGLVLNWTAPLSAIAFLALASTWLPVSACLWTSALGIAVSLILVTLGTYAWAMRSGARAAALAGSALGLTLAIGATVLAAWLIVTGRSALIGFSAGERLTAGGFAGLLAAAPMVIRFIPVLKSPAVRKTVLQVLIPLAGLAVPILALILFFAFRDAALSSYGGTSGRYWLLGIAVVLALMAYPVDVNQTAPLRLYRDSLAETFVRDENLREAIPLQNLNASQAAPYHLINAALNLPSSSNPRLRDRLADFFLFSKHWCGSPLTGYVATGQWRNGKVPLDLATAMAVSGAAVSSRMGMAASRSLSGLLTLLNVRLGFWVRRPAGTANAPATDALGGRPGFACLLREMTGIAMDERCAWLNLSDGGHIENMGIYELLRRRCKFIVSVDGEADPACTFYGLMTLIRHAQIDFGIHMAPDLGEIRPDAATGLSRSHGALFRIHYPAAGAVPAATGLLLYLKLTVTGNEGELIRRYRTAHPDFPHQTTLDQFFDEEQFEAYRALGVHVADAMFIRSLVGPLPPASIAEWFRSLAARLLEPI